MIVGPIAVRLFRDGLLGDADRPHFAGVGERDHEPLAPLGVDLDPSRGRLDDRPSVLTFGEPFGDSHVPALDVLGGRHARDPRNVRGCPDGWSYDSVMPTGIKERATGLSPSGQRTYARSPGVGIEEKA
jgi:hypothetical protein